MAMKASGLHKGLKDVDHTQYADDDMIPYYMKKYVSSATDRGIIKGITTESGEIFAPNDIITRAQAAVILNRILDLPTSDAIEVFFDGKMIPTWAENAVNNLVACGIMSGKGNGILDPEGILTNAQCASLISNVLEWKQNK